MAPVRREPTIATDDHGWPLTASLIRYDATRQALMKAQLERVLAGASSKDTKEIAQRSLA
jgi:hypothetical protein